MLEYLDSVGLLEKGNKSGSVGVAMDVLARILVDNGLAKEYSFLESVEVMYRYKMAESKGYKGKVKELGFIEKELVIRDMKEKEKERGLFTP